MRRSPRIDYKQRTCYRDENTENGTNIEVSYLTTPSNATVYTTSVMDRGMTVELWWNDADTGKTKNSNDSLPQYLSVHYKPTHSVFGSNQKPQG